MKKILIAFMVLSLATSCQVENVNYTVPIMVTYEPESVLTTSASLGGLALGDGGLTISEYGLVYSTNAQPTINDTKIVEGTGYGEFFKSYTNFLPATTYYYRSYGVNQTGTGYGEIYSFTTQQNAACSFNVDNVLDTGNYFGTLAIDYVNRDFDQTSFFDGNVQFITSTDWSVIRIELIFNEVNAQLPKTGTYQTVYNFNGFQPSEGQVMLRLSNYNSGDIGGFGSEPGKTVYVQNNNGVVSFIFCDVELNQYYTLNGKFTYTE
ncbi:hypothetical protein [Flavobacterium subsaxonicum]|uniref:Fibronectin type-III domain-containing protein n=1 Tax=Flavobacterium subsaxonicum WB 4.1-42 = DSM 21790 TaxID=1121898 RepID=A0A0A2MWZ7_9FLAO|nr:hypothetical protein [Flavobacterium subsaxonicum]KGO92730.1 hypothetical protein Q766_11480 [Flavobacterium subsaxonicum WB 4.1-42 = DSM 21790]